MKTLLALITATVLLFGGCSTTTTKPEQRVFDIHGKYAAALKVAVAYKSLPGCDQPQAPLICARHSMVTKLQEADNVAKPSLDAAQSVVRAPGTGLNVDTFIRAAEAATDAFSKITATLPKE